MTGKRVTFEHRRDYPADSLDVNRLVQPNSYGPPRPSA
jgi:hypothetical protein